MGVVVKRKYQNQYRPEVVDWLIGNTGDWQKLELEVDFSVQKRFTQSSPVIFDELNVLTNGDATEWQSYGFDVGDVLNYSFTVDIKDTNGNSFPGYPSTYSDTRNIVSIQNDMLTYDGQSIMGASLDIPMCPYKTGSVSIKNFHVFTDKKPQGAILTYGHIQNSDVDSSNLSSFIDGTQTRIAAINMDTLTGVQNMEFLGLQSGMSIKSAKWNYIQKVGAYTYKYRFVIEFMISSLYEDTSNLELLESPNQTFDAASLTDNFDIIGFPEWNNPNTQIRNKMSDTKRLGNTGWFEENFNGLEDEFEISNVQYEDATTGQALTKLSFGSDVKMKATISGVQNLADATTKCGFGFSLVTSDETRYKNKSTPFHENLKMNTAGGFDTGIFGVSNIIDTTTYLGFSNDGARMDVKDVRFKKVGSLIEFEAVFSPTASFKNYVDSMDVVDRNYVVWLSVADRTKTTNFSNRVNKIADYNSMELFIPPVGEWDLMNTLIYEHQHEGIENITGACNDFIVEDDVLAKSNFEVDINDVIPNAIEFAIELENQITGQKINLQRYKVDLAGFPIASGVPLWDYDQSRGFKYVDGNNKNWVKVKRDPLNDSAGKYGYVAYYGFKMRWEDWIKNDQIPNDFTDANEIHQGHNNDWFQKMGVSGWRMNYTIYLEAIKDGGNVRYSNSTELKVKDYNNNLRLTKEWNFYRDSDNSLLNAGIDPSGEPLGILLENEKVRIEVIWTRLDGVWYDVDQVYGTICIEVDKGSGQFDFRQLSSIVGSESDNPLQPLVGQSRTKMTLIAPDKIKAECLIEPSLLIDAIRYKHSARLGCSYAPSVYGVEWDTENATTLMTRIGNLNLHRSLPIQSGMRRCLLLDNGVVNYYLHEDDSTLKEDGTPAVLDGADGQVMVEIPEFYIKHEQNLTKRSVLISKYYDVGFTRIPKSYVSAYEATVQRSTNKLASVATTDTDYRGGNNSPTNDANSNTLLGKPASSINRPNFRTYARNRGSIKWNMMLHEVRKTIFWLYLVEYANMNCQTAFNPSLDSQGFRQGGLGHSVVTSNDWLDFNSRMGFVDCGFTNSLGNQTGIKSWDVSAWDSSNSTFEANSYRGIENVFSHLWEWTDGINVNIQSDSSGGESEVYIADTLVMSDTDNVGYSKVGNVPRANGYIKNVIFADGEIMPLVTTGASSNTYWSDYFYTTIPSSGVVVRGVLSGGHAFHGSAAGLGCSYSYGVPSAASSDVGSRLCYLPEGV